MKTITICSKLLMIPAILMFIVGVFLAVSNISVNSPVEDPFFKKFFETETPLHSTNIIYTFFLGITGAVAASWSVFIFVLSRRLLKEPEKWIVNCILIAIIIWYIGDTGISYIHGIYVNVVFNTVFFLLVIVPTIIIRVKLKELSNEKLTQN